MQDDFEDHCWKDVISAETMDVYRFFRHKEGIGPAPALVAIDLYEMVYLGGNVPLAEAIKVHPASCGEYAWAAIPPTQRVFAAARRAGSSAHSAKTSR